MDQELKDIRAQSLKGLHQAPARCQATQKSTWAHKGQQGAQSSGKSTEKSQIRKGHTMCACLTEARNNGSTQHLPVPEYVMTACERVQSRLKPSIEQQARPMAMHKASLFWKATSNQRSV